MAKIKKTFDRESMYKKIMPTNLKKEIEVVSDFEESVEIPTHIEKPKAKEVVFFGEEKNEASLDNITEKVVINKLDVTLKKMNCCKCDRCKEDIKAIALNNLKPVYIVGNKEEIKQKIHELKEMSSEVTTEIIKAVLVVRKNPRH